MLLVGGVFKSNFIADSPHPPKIAQNTKGINLKQYTVDYQDIMVAYGCVTQPL